MIYFYFSFSNLVLQLLFQLIQFTFILVYFQFQSFSI